MTKKYKCVFIDRFDDNNIPINNEILGSIKKLDDEFDFEHAVAPRGQIDKQLIEQILNADIVIACIIGIHKHGCDFLNVVYELAFRQGSCRPIIAIASDDDIEKLPFYLRNTQIIKDNDEEKIKKALNDTKSKPDLPDNRVWEVSNEIDIKQTESIRSTFDFYGGRSIWTVNPTKNIKIMGTYLGGIAKELREVDNYILEFKMKIIKRTLGVIILGTPWSSGLMLQFSAEGRKIVPHRYFPLKDDPRRIYRMDSILKPINKKTKYGNIFDNYWYDVEIKILPKLSIKMINKEINNECIFIWDEEDTVELYEKIHPDNELMKWNGNEKELVNTAEKLTRGTIGFRNDYGENMFSDEIALVRDISVTLMPEINKIIVWPY